MQSGSSNEYGEDEGYYNYYSGLEDVGDVVLKRNMKLPTCLSSGT